MYIKFGNEFADGELYLLEQFLKIIDKELLDIQTKIDKSTDPVSDGYCDHGEYLIGYGFIAIQKYMTETYPQTSLKNEKALKLGIRIKNDVSLARAINAGANYWKHEPEWPFVIDLGETIEIESGKTLTRVKRTYTTDIFGDKKPSETFKVINRITV